MWPMNQVSVRLSTDWIALFAANGAASRTIERRSTRARPDASSFWAGREVGSDEEGLMASIGECAKKGAQGSRRAASEEGLAVLVRCRRERLTARDWAGGTMLGQKKARRKPGFWF